MPFEGISLLVSDCAGTFPNMWPGRRDGDSGELLEFVGTFLSKRSPSEGAWKKREKKLKEGENCDVSEAPVHSAAAAERRWTGLNGAGDLDYSVESTRNFSFPGIYWLSEKNVCDSVWSAFPPHVKAQWNHLIQPDYELVRWSDPLRLLWSNGFLQSRLIFFNFSQIRFGLCLTF